MKKEYALTILLSNPVLNEISLKRIEHILKHHIDWNQVFLASLLEKTTFIICRNLLQYHYYWLVPEQLWFVWNVAYLGNIEKNKQLLYYYNILKQKFSQKAITAIPGNGIMLLTTIYKNLFGIRLLHDIDFFTEKKYLPAINEIMNSMNFEKIYVDDRDFLRNPANIYGNNVLYSKYIDSAYTNFDFCSGMNENQSLFFSLINCMKKTESAAFYAAELIVLYLSAAKSWNGKYYTSNIKCYTYSKLIDLHLYRKFYITSETKSLFMEIANNFQLNNLIQDVDATLNFFKKERYLT